MSLLYFLRYPLIIIGSTCALLIPSMLVIGRALPDSYIIAFSTPHPHSVGWEIALLDWRTRIIRTVDYYPSRIPLALSWSPDGSRLAYATFGPPSDIYVHDILAGMTRNLTRTAGDDRYPTWSPDSAQLLFYSNQDALDELFVIYSMAADGSNLRRLTPRQALMPAYSPDGSQVVYTSTDQRDLYLMNTDGTAARPLTRGPRNDHAAVWSPDGTQIAFVGLMYALGQSGQFIFMLDSACLNTTPEICTEQIAFPDFRFQGMPQWSPDSRYLAFVAQNRRDLDDVLYLVDTESDNRPHKLIENVFYNYGERWPMWSPDSRWIAFSRRDEPGLFVMDVATGATQQLAHIEAIYPIWQP